MKSSSMVATLPEIKVNDTLGDYTRHIVELAKPYNTVILLYEDDFADCILAAWAETDRLNVKTRKLGEVYGGIEVHAFGLDNFPPDTVVELMIRETRGQQDPRKVFYRSLLNELTLISVRVSRQG